MSLRKALLKVAFHCPSGGMRTHLVSKWWNVFHVISGVLGYRGPNTSRNPYVNLSINTFCRTPQLINWRTPSKIPTAPQLPSTPISTRGDCTNPPTKCLLDLNFGTQPFSFKKSCTNMFMLSIYINNIYIIVYKGAWNHIPPSSVCMKPVGNLLRNKLPVETFGSFWA